jgi:hypothetical protein
MTRTALAPYIGASLLLPLYVFWFGATLHATFRLDFSLRAVNIEKYRRTSPQYWAAYVSIETAGIGKSLTEIFKAILNQDGSWTISGDLNAVLNHPAAQDLTTRCIIGELIARRTPSNPSPDNSRHISFAEMDAILRADPIWQKCSVFRETEHGWNV